MQDDSMHSDTRSITAEEIAEDLLYRSGRALTHSEYGALEDCFYLPQALETLEGVRVVRSKEDLIAVFHSVQDYYRENQVVNFARAIVDAKFTSETVIESVHVTRLLRAGGEVFRAPFPVYSTLKRYDDGIWRIAQSNYAIPDCRAHSEALLTWKSAPIMDDH